MPVGGKSNVFALVINLRDKEASRENIVTSFDSLFRITSTAEAPAIIICYAGHGANTTKPEGWWSWATNSDKIELLCLSGMGLPAHGEGMNVVEGITDRTICYLLNKLSRARGNSITLILDCCCSTGINRGAGSPVPPGFIPRRIQRPPPVSPGVDVGILSEPNASRLNLAVAAGFTEHFQDPHVLMAACGRDQMPYEKDGRGLFTQS